MKRQPDLEYLVTTTLIDHYQTHAPGLIKLVKQLLREGYDPIRIEAIVQQHCSTRSAVAAHAYRLAVYYSSTLMAISLN